MAKIYVLSGGPGTGKTTVLNELKKLGYKTLPEAARFLSETDKRFIGKSIKETNREQFQEAIFDLQKIQINSKYNGIIFSDRGFGDSIAYYKKNKIIISEDKFDLAKKFKYSGVFIFDPLDFYENDKLRQEPHEEQKEIHNLIIKTYKDLGYKPILVPFMSPEERVNFILSKVN